MNDFKFEPPTPPWESEPEPLELGIATNPEAEKELGLDNLPPEEPEPTEPTPEFVDLVPQKLYNGKPVMAEYAEESEDVNGDELDGFFFYRIKATQGITHNGTHYPTGAYWFNRETCDGIESIDAPFQS